MADFDADARENGYCGYIGDELEHPCRHGEGWGYENATSGFCSAHGERGAPENNQNAKGNPGNPDAEPPEGNGNAEKHGFHANRSLYYERRSPEEQDWIDTVADSWLADAPFGEDHEGGVEQIRKVAIDEHKRRRANAYIDKEGLITENVVGYDDDDEPIVKKEENPANLPHSRLTRDSIRVLKTLGVLNDPDTQQAEAMNGWVEAAQRLADEQDAEADS